MSSSSDDELRDKIGSMLAAGLKTRTEPFPQTDQEFGKLLAEVRKLASADLMGKLVLAGFTDQPHGTDQMRCQECIYYLVHRKWCDLPELAVPVKADWWCRLWRI